MFQISLYNVSVNNFVLDKAERLGLHVSFDISGPESEVHISGLNKSVIADFVENNFYDFDRSVIMSLMKKVENI